MKKKNEEDTKVFFISPIGKEGSTQRNHSDFILSNVLRPIFSEYKMNVIRAEEIVDKPDKVEEIYGMLRYAHILIADLYEQTPNVMHEIGIALAWGRVPILIVPDDISKLPFDLRHLTHITYSSEIAEPSHSHDIDALKKEINKRVINGQKNNDLFLHKKAIPFLQDCCNLEVKIEKLKEEFDYMNTLISEKFDKVDTDFEKTRSSLGEQAENILSLLKTSEKSFNAVFIEGEDAAFEALTGAVKGANKSVKTTRFSEYAVVNRHDDFFNAIQQAAGRLSDRLFRIIAVNSHEKLTEVQRLVTNNVCKKLTIVLTKMEYSFEIVVIDDEEAFIHFRRADRPDVLIASTLYVKEKKVASAFSEIFDQIARRDAIEQIDCSTINHDNVPDILQKVGGLFNKLNKDVSELKDYNK